MLHLTFDTLKHVSLSRRMHIDRMRRKISTVSKDLTIFD